LNSWKYNRLKKDLRKRANPRKAKLLQKYFKTGPGEYGAGDVFLGVMVLELRKLAKKYKYLTLPDLAKNISSKFHEERLTALLILLEKLKKTNEADRKQIFDFYIKNRKYVNSWGLVDITAPKIVGAYLENKDKSILYKFAKSKDLWERRIAILSTFYYISKGDCKDALKIADILKNDKHDLIQKAVGWMLREVGKKNMKIEEAFLERCYQKMPRVILRYAVEKFPENKRKRYNKKS